MQNLKEKVRNWLRVRGYRRGFTLIELLVVIAIISILAGLSLPALRRARIKAMEAKAKSMISSLQIALSMYETDFGSYPNYDGGAITYEYEQDKIMELLTGRDRTNAAWDTFLTMSSQWNGPYLDLKRDDVKRIDNLWHLIDPWGTPYVICVALDKSTSTRPWHNVYGYDIYSLGPDRLTYGNQNYDSTSDEGNLTDDSQDGDSDSSTDDTNPRHDDINNW